MVFNWTVPASSSAGTVAILAVVNVANPVTGGYTTVSSQSPSLQLVTGGYIWAVTTPSSCSVPCGQVIDPLNKHLLSTLL